MNGTVGFIDVAKLRRSVFFKSIINCNLSLDVSGLAVRNWGPLAGKNP